MQGSSEKELKKAKKQEKEERKKRDEEEKKAKKENEKKVKDEKKRLKESFKSDIIEKDKAEEPKRNSLPNLPSSPSSEFSTNNSEVGNNDTSPPTSNNGTPNISREKPLPTPPNKNPPKPLPSPPVPSSTTPPSTTPLSTTPPSTTPPSTTPRSTTPPLTTPPSTSPASASPTQVRRDNSNSNAFDFWLQREKKSGSPVPRRAHEDDSPTTSNSNTSITSNASSTTSTNITSINTVNGSYSPKTVHIPSNTHPSSGNQSGSNLNINKNQSGSNLNINNVNNVNNVTTPNASPVNIIKQHNTTPPSLSPSVSREVRKSPTGPLGSTSTTGTTNTTGTTTTTGTTPNDRKVLVATLALHTRQCVACMQKTIQVYLQPMYEAARKEPSMLDPCTKQGFSLYESLYGLINVLREDLDKNIASWNDSTSLGSLFLRIVKFFKMYSQYAGQYNIMISMINFHAFDNPRFEALVKGGEQRMQAEFQSKGVPVVELATNTRIIKPFRLRRILSQDAAQPEITMGEEYDQYSLPTLLLVPVYFIQVQAFLLRSLTLATPRQHPEYGQLTATLAHLEATINTILAEDDVLYKTLFIQHTIRSSTIGLFGEPLPDRRLIKEGTLTEALASTKQTYNIFLFTDIIAFTEPPNADGLHMLKKYELVSECKVSDPDLGFDNKKGFQFKTKDNTSMLYAASEKEKSEWLTAFNKANQKTAVVTIKTIESDTNKAPVGDFEGVIRDLKTGDRDRVELQGLKADEGKELVYALVGNQSLAHLSITNSSSLGDRFARLFTMWLASSLSLTHLTLSGVSLSASNAVQLSDTLQCSLHITFLDLRSNTIADAGVVALSEVMLVLPHLTELHLENTACGETGARAIANKLKHTHSLSVLGLEGNSIPAEMMINHFAACIESTLVTPLTIVTFESAEFQKKIEPALTYNKSRKARKDQEINPALYGSSNKSIIDVGYMGSGELNIQMLNKVNLYQGNRRLAEATVARLDHNSCAGVSEAVLEQLTGTHTLLLYHNFIRDLVVPPSLVALTHLDVAHNRLASIPTSIYSLHGLTWLDASCNSISSVSMEIKNLTALSTLMLHTNLLSRPPKELLSMTTLTTLSIGGNTSIPTTSQKIYGAWALKSTKLDLSRSCITALPTDIAILTRLTELDLHHNELKTIPPQIGDLTNLKILDVSQNPQMESLPVQLWKLTNLQKLNIEGNHPHMYSDGIKPNMEASAILGALKLQADSQSMQSCSRLKIMLVGQENVGKTTLAKSLKQKTSGKRALTMRLKEGALAISLLAPAQYSSSSSSATSTPTASSGSSNPFGTHASAPNVSTDGIEMEEWDPEDDGVSFTIWDFAGQEVYYATHAFFISARSIFVVCFNMATGDEAARVPYWLQCIEAWGPGSPVIIVGTHLDEVSKDRADQWSEEVKEKYMTRFPNVVKFVPISSKSAKNIGKLQKTILTIGREDDSVKKMYPRGLFQLEGLLLSERAIHQNTPPVITRADFAAMAKCCGLDDIPMALEELHRLGTLLYFRDTSSELSDLVILDPKWLARLMATLITTKRAFVKLGILHHSQLEHIWRAPDFPPWLHSALLTMVQRFELCYPLPAQEDSPEQRFLVPSLLPETKPAALSSLVLASLYSNNPSLGTGNQSPVPAGTVGPVSVTPKSRQMLSFSGAPLVRLYQFRFLPFGFFSRLMIRIMNFLEPVHYWKTGIVLCKDDNQVCVEYRPHNHTIIVQIWGPKSPTYWRYIRESIALLFDGWYKRLQFQISIPCLCAGCLLDKAASTPTATSPVSTQSSSGTLRTSHSAGSGSSLTLGVSNITQPLPSVVSDPNVSATSLTKDKAPGTLDTTSVTENSSTQSSVSSIAQAEQQENLSDAEDENIAALPKAKGKFQALRKTIRIRVNHKQRSEISVTGPTNTLTHSSSQSAPAPKDDFAECHIFPYDQCESAVMAGQKTIMCAKSQINVLLDSIVPELTMVDLANLQVKFSDLEILEKIAEGGFGAVFKGKLNGTLVAVKQLIEAVHEDANAAYREFWREVFMSSILVHKCIVSLKAFTVSPCCIVMEYMPSGNLYTYLRTRTDITWQSKLRMAINIADAMAFLHSQKPKICHRDLKSPNILMADKSDPEILCKISDFGESRLVATSGQGRQNLANPLWLAPEVMRGGEYSEKCDVYSFGIIMWELLTGTEPFDEFPVAKTGFMSMLEDAIIAGLRPTIPSLCNSEYKALLERAWDDDPDKRPTFQSLHSSLLAIKVAKFTLGSRK